MQLFFSSSWFFHFLFTSFFPTKIIQINWGKYHIGTSSSAPSLHLSEPLSVGVGELVAVLGPVGSGKSSLLKAFLGELPRTPLMQPPQHVAPWWVGGSPIGESEHYFWSFPQSWGSDFRFFFENIQRIIVTSRCDRTLESWWMYKGIILKWAIRLVKYYHLPRRIGEHSFCFPERMG